jgi:hypothetical protein
MLYAIWSKWRTQPPASISLSRIAQWLGAEPKATSVSDRKPQAARSAGAQLDDKAISDLMQMGVPMGKPPPGDRSMEFLTLPLGASLPPLTP